MTAYINRLLAVMIACQLSIVLAPDTEIGKRSVRIVCALVSFLTILFPLNQFLSSTDSITEKITSFFSVESAQIYDEKTTVFAEILQYVTTQYDLDEVFLTIVTDESDTTVTELRFYIENCPYATRALIETELTETFGIPVYVSDE